MGSSLKNKRPHFSHNQFLQKNIEISVFFSHRCTQEERTKVQFVGKHHVRFKRRSDSNRSGEIISVSNRAEDDIHQSSEEEN